jgi:hypothetical protein
MEIARVILDLRNGLLHLAPRETRNCLARGPMLPTRVSTMKGMKTLHWDRQRSIIIIIIIITYYYYYYYIVLIIVLILILILVLLVLTTIYYYYYIFRHRGPGLAGRGNKELYEVASGFNFPWDYHYIT